MDSACFIVAWIGFGVGYGSDMILAIVVPIDTTLDKIVGATFKIDLGSKVSILTLDWSDLDFDSETVVGIVM